MVLITWDCVCSSCEVAAAILSEGTGHFMEAYCGPCSGFFYCKSAPPQTPPSSQLTGPMLYAIKKSILPHPSPKITHPSDKIPSEPVLLTATSQAALFCCRIFFLPLSSTTALPPAPSFPHISTKQFVSESPWVLTGGSYKMVDGVFFLAQV